MCNCCGDCCGVLGAVKKFPKPADLVFSNYQAAVNRESCTGCEICLDRCQMDAITMTDDVSAEVNLDRCIGCGLCVTTCPADAIRLSAKADAGRRIPPATSSEQMMQIAKIRGVI
jgi:Na+-translocating ferredoxin:NAD+ oxidoreductase RNF subunit RnfB